jgi:hypothetical protein
MGLDLRLGVQRFRRVFPIVATAIALLSAACHTGAATGKASMSESPGGRSVESAKDFAAATFSDPANVSNSWLPLVPGTRWTWKGHAYDDENLLRRKVVITVTNLTKMIGGVRTIIAYDLDYNDGRLAESEIALFAQDDEGNVWQFGEYPEEYEGGEIVKTPAWIAGIQGARAGLAMKAEPAVGAPSYAQGWGPAVGWNDRAEIAQMGERTCVPAACYTDVLIVREFSRTVPGAFQTKYYAPEVGNVRVGWGGPKEEEREEMALVALEHLDAAALADVDATVLDQEARAYEISSDVYAKTSPIEPAS